MREYGTVLVEELNVRLKPGSDSRDIIGNVCKGERLTIIGRRDGEKARWLEIEWRGYAAWVAERNAGTVYVRVESKVPDCPRIDPVDMSVDLSPWPVVLWVGGGALIGLLLLFWLLAP